MPEPLEKQGNPASKPGFRKCRQRECDALRSGATFHAIERDRVFVFERSTHLQKLIIAVNPSRDCKALQLPDGSYRTIFSIGENEISGTSLRLGLQSFAILEAE